MDRYAFAQNGEDFYVISGVSGGPNTTNVWRYNATTNIWTKRANIPTASQGPAGAFLNGKIYVVTGDGPANAFYIYTLRPMSGVQVLRGRAWPIASVRPPVRLTAKSTSLAAVRRSDFDGFDLYHRDNTGAPGQPRQRRCNWLVILRSGNIFM